MSSFIPTPLAVPAEVAAGTPVPVNPRSPIGFSYGDGAGEDALVATTKFQYSPVSQDPASLPNSVWYDVASALTAAGYQTLPAGRAVRVRANCTAYTSGIAECFIFHDQALDVENLERNFEEALLEIPDSTAAGAALTLQDGEQATIHVHGTFSKTLQLQISLSLDGAIWHNYGKALTAAGILKVPKGIAQRIRFNVTHVSGTATGNVLRGFAHEDGDDASVETVSAPGALSLFARTTLLSIDGADAHTLADGLYEGQRKSIRVIAATTAPVGTLTPSVYYDGASGTTHKFWYVGQTLELEWHDATGWNKVGEHMPANVVQTAPASGAISIYSQLVRATVTGTPTFTIANGLFDGQEMEVIAATLAALAVATVTPATFADGTSVTFAAQFDSVRLRYFASGGWRVMALGGTAAVI